MKLNQVRNYIYYTLCGVMALLAVACTNEEWTDVPVQPALGPGLHISLVQNGEALTASRSTNGVDNLNENKINTVDVFIFKSDGTLNLGGYVHSDITTADNVVTVYQGNNWLDNFSTGESYSAYVVANYEGSENLREITSLDGLKRVTAVDRDITKWQGMGNPPYQDKVFLMDGFSNFTYDELASADRTKPYELPVKISRAAVKIELTINFSDDWKNKFQATGLKTQLTNYATVTPVIADGNPLDADQRGFATYPETPTDPKLRFSSDPIFTNTSADGWEGSQIRFYTYTNRWDDVVANETMLLIDLPGNMKDGSEQQLEHNFYKIPIISNARPQILERNTFYQITATVDMKGSADVDTPVELNDVQFQTAKWEENTINVGEGDNPTYLILNRYLADVRNANGYDGLEFYSSSPVTVEIVGFNSQAEATAAGVEFTYPGEGTSIPGIFFINKNNQRTNVKPNDPNNNGTNGSSASDKVEVTYDEGTNGKIHLTSTNPINVTKRYITLKVTNRDRLTKYVVIEQYPLEYIQPIAGWYSYRDDLKATGGTYEEHGSQSMYKINVGSWIQPNYKIVSRSNNKYFMSKVKEEGSNYIRAWYWEQNSSQWSRQTADGTSFAYDEDTYSYGSFNSVSNNMMYFVTITRTSEDYKIAHPLTMKSTSWDNQLVTVDNAENNEFVSPTFMLASQLGTVYSNYIKGWTEARKHCAYYVETYKDKNGNTQILDDWRLPTSEEIGVIIGYQDNSNVGEVMDEVLTGTFYYVGYSEATDGINSQPKGTAFTGKRNDNGEYVMTPAVRCIRDVKPTDAFLRGNNE